MRVAQITKITISFGLIFCIGFALMAVPKETSKVKHTEKTKVLSGPYGIRIEPDPGCEKGAKYVLQRLKTAYIPKAIRYYGNPFGGKDTSRVFTVKVSRNDGSGGSEFTGWTWGDRGDNQFALGLAKGWDETEFGLAILTSRILTVCVEENGTALYAYVNKFVQGKVNGSNPIKQLKDEIKQGLSKKDGNSAQDREMRNQALKWAVFEELRKKHPTFMLDYFTLKNKRFNEKKIPARIPFSQMVALLGEVTGEKVDEMFTRHGVRVADGEVSNGKSVAENLRECEFLLNKEFKKDAKYYLCLFSASWCGPCRHEMPRIAKTYAETLKDDPDIELIHFSRDQDEEKALAWAEEHDVKFPVVKPNGGNPLNLHARGIPHLFILKTDGTLVEHGHPMQIFTEEKILSLKQVKE